MQGSRRSLGPPGPAARVPGNPIVGVVDVKKLFVIVAGLLAAIVAGGANFNP